MKLNPDCKEHTAWKKQKILDMPHNQSFIIKGEAYTTSPKDSDSYMKRAFNNTFPRSYS